MLSKCEPAALANESIEAGTPANRGIQAVRANQPSKEKPPPIHIGGNGIFRFDVGTPDQVDACSFCAIYQQAMQNGAANTMAACARELGVYGRCGVGKADSSEAKFLSAVEIDAQGSQRFHSFGQQALTAGFVQRRSSRVDECYAETF
jgi:hypothetical protein